MQLTSQLIDKEKREKWSRKMKWKWLAELQRAHWVIHSQTECFVDIISCGNTLKISVRWMVTECSKAITFSSHMIA